TRSSRRTARSTRPHPARVSVSRRTPWCCWWSAAARAHVQSTRRCSVRWRWSRAANWPRGRGRPRSCWARGRRTAMRGTSGERLSKLGLSWVHARGYIDAMPEALSATDVAVTRAGAMATAELLAWGRPMLLVPLPTAAADHQTHNARALADSGAGVMILEKDM